MALTTLSTLSTLTAFTALGAGRGGWGAGAVVAVLGFHGCGQRQACRQQAAAQAELQEQIDGPAGARHGVLAIVAILPVGAAAARPQTTLACVQWHKPWCPQAVTTSKKPMQPRSAI
jgi:hypothetical protein